MIFIRSLLYTIWLYGTMAVIAISFAPFAFFSTRAACAAARIWSKLALAGLVIVGARLEIRGRENIPAGAALVASKHQSMLDTMVPHAFLSDPAIVLKKELDQLPVFGWYTRRAGMIVVDRETKASALRALLRQARERAGQGRPVFIYPEGTRQELGAPPDYKPGVAALYRDLNLPCVPVAVSAGKVWPAHGVLRKPGVAVVEFLPAIPTGLSREAFMAELQARIEQGTQRLLEERS